MKALLKALLPASVRTGLRRAQGTLLTGIQHRWQVIGWQIRDRLEVWSGRRDPVVPPARLRDYVGTGDFLQVGVEFLRHFTTLGGLQPTDRVLDVGCGIGRIAGPLTKYLTTGSYDGFDIIPVGIHWCRRNITPRYPNFRFHHADVYNAEYYPQGHSRAADYRFPLSDDSFDFVYLISVFTHMLPTDLRHYLGEVTRVLRPGGRCLITYFILNDESLLLLREGKALLPPIIYEGAGFMTSDPHVPERIIAYPEADLRAFYHDARLLIQEPIRYGGWCQRANGYSFHDIIVAAKPGS